MIIDNKISKTKAKNILDMKILGVIRFSYLSIGGYQLKISDLNSHRQFLYETARLERRLRIFENLTLPSLQAQTNSDYQLILLIGDDFPAWAEERVKNSIKGLPISMKKLPPMPTNEAIATVFNAELSGRAEIEVAFRMDDDDAISRNFIQDLWSFAPIASTMLQQYPAVSYFYKKGVMFDFSNPEPQIDKVMMSEPWGIGLSVFRRRGETTSPYSLAHYHFATKFPYFCDPRKMGFIRSLHDDCDSRKGINKPYAKAKIIEIDKVKLLEMMVEEFGLSEENMEVFSKFHNETGDA